MQRWTAFAEFSSRRLTSCVARKGVRFKPLASARTNVPTGSLLRVHSGACAIMIVAVPIKRPYIWDLAPSSSAIRYCLNEGLRVRLLEWLPASRRTSANGLAEYAQAIGECVAKVSGQRESRKPFLLGHSLGGTLAAIFAAMAPDSICGLVLIGAPLCFRPATSRFRDALVSLVPSDLDDTEPCPGSLLTQTSALASPETFVWSRLTDAALSVANQAALET